MDGRIGTVARSAALLLTVSVAGLVAVTGTAAAGPDPLVLDSCTAAASGSPGRAVSLSPSAVADPVTELITAVPLLGPQLGEPFRREFAALGPIPVGAIPPGSGYLSGDTVAADVVDRIRHVALLGPVIAELTDRVRQALSQMCGIPLRGDESVSAAPRPSTGAPDIGAGGNGGAPHAPVAANTDPMDTPSPPRGSDVDGASAYDYGRVPLFSYDVPFAIPGEFAPSAGVPSGGDHAPGGERTTGPDDTLASGQAQPLPDDGGQLGPTLIAVLALAGLGSALTRFWFLRRTDTY
ncbi:MAG: hypothetical protein JOZ47_07265 [Kutzneria sp.]|nr:hypothetical protein [Kutzneria sp.]MBV9844856.1 hypothetical protein [Kutzneria sp.]